MSDDQDFTNLFGSDDEASDIDDGRSQTSQQSQTSPQPPSLTQRPQTTVSDNDDDDDDSDAGSDAIMYTRQQNTVDDLFGSEEEEEEEDIVAKRQQRRLQKRAERHTISDVEEDESRDQQQEDGILYDEEEELGEDEYDMARKQQRVEVELNMPALPIPNSEDGKYFLAKLPRFLDIDMKPFDANTLQLEVEEGMTEAEQLESIRQQVESTIRWRQRFDENGNEKIESNAHFVDWEDGSRSLMIGQECFDVVTKSMSGQEYTFLLAHQTSSGVLESHTQFTDHMTFQPSHVHSLTHRHLTAHIAGKHVKKTRTKMFFTDMDPEKQKQELEAQENERLRAAKKLESQRRRAELQFDDSGRHQDYDYGEDEENMGGGRRRGNGVSSRVGGIRDEERGTTAGGYVGRGDAYDEDFVVDDEDYDEEEEREREQRLAQVKQSGMDRYRRRHSDEEEEEEEEEEEMEEEEEEEEEVVVRRHKRRHVESDDE
ncbi:Leo1-like protein-domain-containing protein [Halteromyces radiatus]|uniref:Leo1-like protein-domain-containing protein n=1 Tax=Halteromyces radiatus TaxID=101107 RepID=UPI00221E9464|nr:Leo1-like protein-domain-containing protein [Halteromyces radiatus]KAI8099570.1 Leo1-like protein-domain-containing protein [Halteromyces radiatus]